MNWLEEHINTIVCGDCVAAKETDRRYLGIEIDDGYYKTSVDRLNGITSTGQTSIFTDFGGIT